MCSVPGDLMHISALFEETKHVLSRPRAVERAGTSILYTGGYGAFRAHVGLSLQCSTKRGSRHDARNVQFLGKWWLTAAAKLLDARYHILHRSTILRRTLEFADAPSRDRLDSHVFINPVLRSLSSKARMFHA